VCKDYELRLLSIVETSSDLVGIAEMSGRYIYMNRSFRDILEISDDSVQGSHMFEWHSPNHRASLMKTVLATAREVGLWSGESSLHTKSGKDIPVILTVYAHTNHDVVEYYSTLIRLLSTMNSEEDASVSRMLLRRTIQVQESERQRLAKELHDGVGQSLYSILLGLQYLQGHSTLDSERILLQQWIDELHKGISIVKLFAHQLRPHSLDQLGLIPAIEQLIARIRALDDKLQVRILTNFEPSQRFHDSIETNVFRIVQEALHNILKHAKAKKVEIALALDEETLVLSVQDNGSGFPTDEPKEGLGLRHMEERAYALDGSLNIFSAKHMGTTIKLKIPLKEETH